jgi:ribonucleoside-diphosphate reductase alpha chain
MALQYGVPLITLVDKFRHARFEPAGMTSNKEIPFAKSVIDYIFCWLGCQFIPGYAEKNTPNRAAATVENKTVTTAKQLVEKTKDLAQKIAEAKAEVQTETKVSAKRKAKSEYEDDGLAVLVQPPVAPSKKGRFGNVSGRVGVVVGSFVGDEEGAAAQGEGAVMQQFNAQFEHFQDDAPACDVCGSITVRNGSCYKCFNCGNSMGCS